jgi:hypothetical protein
MKEKTNVSNAVTDIKFKYSVEEKTMKLKHTESIQTKFSATDEFNYIFTRS